VKVNGHRLLVTLSRDLYDVRETDGEPELQQEESERSSTHCDPQQRLV
jgi:hypothetical protein